MKNLLILTLFLNIKLKIMKKGCVIVTYDIQDNKLRTQFSKFLEKHGVRLQFSVFEIHNSDRMIKLVCEKIERDFKPGFSEADSILLFFTNLEQAITYGNASHLNKDVVFVG